MSENAAEQDRLGIVTSFFPSLTETFIYGEIAGLVRLGVPLRVYSVRRPPAAGVAEEVRRLRELTFYIMPLRWGRLAAAHARWLFLRPLRYLSTLAVFVCGQHDRLRDRLRTLVHFAEGVLVAEQARRDGVGHFHAHYASHPATIAWTAARLLDATFSFTAHAYDIWWDRLLLPQKLLACRFAVTCTRNGARRLLEAAPMVDPGKVCTVYHGVDLERFRPAERQPNAEFTILSIARLDRPKGQNLLLAALDTLAKEGYRFRLCIAGDGPFRGELEELTRLYGLQERVSFAGRVYHENLPGYYRQADFFALPCYREGNYQDNLPNVLLEAMACGVPVVSTRMQGIPELIEDGVSGLLVAEQDVAGLTRALRRLMDDPEAAARIGQAGRLRVVEHFDQATSVRLLAGLYSSQLRVGRRSALRVVGGGAEPARTAQAGRP